ncbi:ATP-binding protein [Algoriphagus limi]|uniref:histidine kinase n=1 Tax=Algoriphagus limi TaxID=2975273 RepID=A0ABT2G1H6_9BACT|nr:ATP-binding protein [Algoriphagus limi]MCS5489120.1 ATP-binding protein [Algoriphagus limi]
MKDRGINSTFKKIIYESSEMVFLADDSYPYNIFYANESFEDQIGETLQDRSLAGLGLDISNYIFKEELLLNHDGKEFLFRLELPEDNGTNYYLFYKGVEIKTQGLPSNREIQEFFKRGLDILAVGQHDYLTYLNDAVKPVLGYAPEELIDTSLCSFVHEDDLEKVRKIWKNKGGGDKLGFFHVRIKKKSGGYALLECSVQFAETHFYLISRDQTEFYLERDLSKKLLHIQQQVPSLSNSVSFNLDLRKGKINWDKDALEKFKVESKKERKSLFQKIQLKIETDSNKPKIDANINWKDQDLKLVAEKTELPNGREVWIGYLADDSTRQELLDEKSLLESFLFRSPEPLVVSLGSKNIIHCNEAARKLLGLDKETSFDDLTQLEELFEETENWKEWLDQIEKGEEVQPLVAPILNQKGKSLTLEICYTTFEEKSNQYFLFSFKNISEKLSLEKTLEESSNFLINLTEQVPGGLYQLVLDKNGGMNFSFLSKGITSVLGISESEIEEFTDISSTITKVHPQDLPHVIMTSVASARKLEPWQCQFRVKDEHQPGGFRWVLGAARPQILENGDMVWYGYLTDISKQKEFEAKLDEARQTAEKASQIKSDFLSMISHELRTPLNAISGSVYSLLQENPSNSQKNTLNTISFAVDNLIIMINDLLDFQKIEAGKLSIEKAPFNLTELVHQVMKGLAFHARDSKNSLNLHLDSNLDLDVKGDKTRLSQILNNLITNALKFTHDGKVDLTVKLLKKNTNQVRVYFEVKDTGIGIAPEHQDRIFNDFDQIKPTFSTKYGGTGLGLSITRKLLNLMNSSIQLESEPNKGSRFFFEVDFDLVENEGPKNVILNGFNRDFSSLHLLMAEDNDVNALVLGKIIKKWGYTFDRVPNGALAVEAVQTKKYDCVLMDIQMPVMDGFEATVEIKKIIDIPVIALTAAAKLEIMEKVESCGFDGFVAKPIDAAELLKKIKEVISEKNHNF